MSFETREDAELAIRFVNALLADQMFDEHNNKTHWPLMKVFNAVGNAILGAEKHGIQDWLADLEPRGGLVKVRLPEVLGINPLRTLSSRSLEGYLRDEYSYFDSQRLYTIQEFERHRAIIEELWGCPVIIKRMYDNPRGVTILPAPPSTAPVLPELIPLSWWPDDAVVLGTDVFTGEVVSQTIQDMTHMLVAGTSGFGKSVFLNQIITQLMAASTDEVAELLLIDLKGGVEFYGHRNEDNRVRVVWDLNDLEDTFNDCIELMYQRQQEMVENGWRLYPGRRIFVIIDEFAQIQLYRSRVDTKEDRARHAQLLANLNRLSMLGRAVGVVLIVATQKPTTDAMDSSFRMNLQGQVCFHVPNRLIASSMFGSVEELKVDPVSLTRGRFIYYNPIVGVTQYLQSHVAAD